MKNLFGFFLFVLLLASCTDEGTFDQEIKELQNRSNLELQTIESNAFQKPDPAQEACLIATQRGTTAENGCCQYNITYPYPFGQLGVEIFLVVDGERADDPTFFRGNYIWNIIICEDAVVEVWRRNINGESNGNVICSANLSCEPIASRCCDFCLDWNGPEINGNYKAYTIDLVGGDPDCGWRIHDVIATNDDEHFELSHDNHSVTFEVNCELIESPVGFHIFVTNDNIDECEGFDDFIQLGSNFQVITTDMYDPCSGQPFINECN